MTFANHAAIIFSTLSIGCSECFNRAKIIERLHIMLSEDEFAEISHCVSLISQRGDYKSNFNNELCRSAVTYRVRNTCLCRYGIFLFLRDILKNV